MITTSGTTETLQNDCSTTVTLTVPDGFTFDGNGHTITALDPTATTGFSGPVITNAGSSMNIENLTVQGDVHNQTPDFPIQYVGVRFFNASGSVTSVTVLDISAPNSGPNDGYGIRVDATVPVDVTITGSTFAGYRRNGAVFSGPATDVDVTGSTFGPPDLSLVQNGGPAQNGAQYSSGAGGTFSGNTVIGTTFGNAAVAPSTTFLLFGAVNVTASDNQFIGAGQDLGVSVTSSTGILIEDNNLDRTPATVPGGSATGAQSFDAMSTAGTTLICNTFEGWSPNLAGGLTQAPCITSTSPLQSAALGVPFSQTLQAFDESGGALVWSFAGGTLPPGLTLDSSGVLSGTPTQQGTFTFTAQVCDSTGVDGCSTMEFTITVGAAPPPPPTPETPSVPSGPVQTGGGLVSDSSPWLPYGGAAAGVGLLLAVGGLAWRRQRTGA
jgi:hypothetical protein